MTTDLNDRIALAKGWWPVYIRSRVCNLIQCDKEVGEGCSDCDYVLEEWMAPTGVPMERPDFTGTLGDMSDMLRELNKPRSIGDRTLRWLFYWDRSAKEFVCEERVYVENAAPAFCVQHRRQFWSSQDRPGDCVGSAWLSVFDKPKGT